MITGSRTWGFKPSPFPPSPVPFPVHCTGLHEFIVPHGQHWPSARYTGLNLKDITQPKGWERAGYSRTLGDFGEKECPVFRLWCWLHELYVLVKDLKDLDTIKDKFYWV